MIEFVERISIQGKKKNKDFLLFVQNAPCIVERENFSDLSKKEYHILMGRFWAAIDGIGIEDIFFYGDKEFNNPYAPQKYELGCIRQFQRHGKVVVAVDYVGTKKKMAQATKEYKRRGMIGLNTDRLLKAKFIRYTSLRRKPVRRK